MLNRRNPIDHAFLEAMRERIDIARLIDRLCAHVADAAATPMTKTQVQCAFGLLRKVMPDLQAVELTAAPAKPLEEMTDADLLAAIRQLQSAREAAAGVGSQAEPKQTH